MRGSRFRQLFQRIFGTGRGERRGILALLPILGVVAIFVHGARKGGSDPALRQAADSVMAVKTHAPEDSPVAAQFYFDPNTVTLEELCDLGLELRVAASIVKYRNSGKKFTAPEDLAMCYGVTLEQYRKLEPYIIIGEATAADRPERSSATRKPANNPANRYGSKVTLPRAPFDPNTLGAGDFEQLGFTPAQARTIINYRTSLGGFTSSDQFAKCYAVSDEAYAILEPYLYIGTTPSGPAPDTTGGSDEVAIGMSVRQVLPVELNTADSAALRSVSGIGEVLVVRIMEYRDRLGGFVRSEQLAEVQGMTEANYERIRGQIRVDSCNISKIDINFAPHKELARRLERHPYVTAKSVRKLLSVRQLKGGWSNTRELVEDKIWNEEEAVKMAPYVVFRLLED